MNNLTLGSLFDGSGGFPLGGILSGITPVWASEIEPFPIRVTTRRMPFMKHYGDISQMDGGKVEPVDIITFGSPCTDMSVAGKRAGLGGHQSVLFYEAIRIIKEMRYATGGKYPRYIVWENVPGAFSSNKGEDFKAVLESVIGIVEPGAEVPPPEKGRWPYSDCYVGDGWSLAYRTLDAQYWGVAQRRRRIYLVADLTGGSAEDILFKSEGLSGYSAESFRSWQRTTCCVERSAGASGRGIDGYNGAVSGLASTLGVNCGSSTGRNGVVLNDQGGGFMSVSENVSGTLRAQMDGHPPVVIDAVALENHPTDSRVKVSEDGNVQTLTSRMGTGGNNVPLVLKIRSGCDGGGKGPLIQTDKSATLSCNNDQTLFMPCSWNGGQTAPTLTAHNAGGSQRMPDKDHFNCVLQPFGICSDGSNAMRSPNPKSGIYEAETARTIDTSGTNPTCNQGGIAVVCVDQGGGKSSCSVSEGHSPTLSCTHGGSPAVCIQGSMIGRKDKNGPQGDGINEEVSFTLNTVDRHAVYAMTTGSYAHISEEKAPTLLSRDYKDATVVTEPAIGIGRDAYNQGENAKFDPSFVTELQPTLVAKGPGAVAAPVGFYPQMKAECMTPVEEKATTLVNGTNPGFQNGVVESGYAVRRLTPTECARLQGFPDWWCGGLETPDPSVSDISYWYKVFETHRRITNSEAKPKSLKQIAKWLKDPYSDSAEYKMWGNGVALPCVWFVLAGIVYSTQKEG